MTTNKPKTIAWGVDPREISEADLLPCPACGNQAGKATKRAAKGFPFVGLWKVSCQRPECPLAMIYFHPVEWNQLPRIKQAEHESLKDKCRSLEAELAESRANDKQAMAYLEAVREIVGGDSFPEMIGLVKELQIERNGYKLAFKEWLEKSEWVQETASVKELGKHRADVMRERIQELLEERDKLVITHEKEKHDEN